MDLNNSNFANTDALSRILARQDFRLCPRSFLLKFSSITIINQEKHRFTLSRILP